MLVLREELILEAEDGKEHGKCTVVVMSDGINVRHAPFHLQVL